MSAHRATAHSKGNPTPAEFHRNTATANDGTLSSTGSIHPMAYRRAIVPHATMLIRN